METTLASRTIYNPVIKDKVTYLELSGETGGKYSLGRIELAPAGGNELHYHKTYDETFTCQEGVLGLQVGKETILLDPGQSVTAKAGELHRFFNPSKTETVTFNVLIQPGAPGFERMLQVLYGLAADGLVDAKGVPKNLYHTALIIHWSDTNLPGMLTYLEPVMKWLAKRAIKKGIEKELIARYVRY